jgi:orotate phosphoribosyltransferase
MKTTDAFVQFLVETGALRFGDFVTKSGRKTPYFINTGEFRTGPALARLARFYAEAYEAHFGDKADNLFGPAYKGIPLCAATAMALHTNFKREVSFTYNRKEAKDHGEGGVLVGDTYTKPTRVVIIEDVITAGTSVNETMQILSKLPNVQMKGLLISVDRREKLENGKSALQQVQENYGIEAHSIISIDDIIAFLKDPALREAIGAPADLLSRVDAYRAEWGV